MAALAGASSASEPPDRSLPPPLADYSPSHQSIPVTNSPTSSDLDLSNNDTVHQFPDLVKNPSSSTNQVIISTQVSPEIGAAVHTSEHVRVSSDVALTPSVPVHGSYAAAVRASLPLESPTSADDISSGRAKVNIQLPRVTFPMLNENGIPRVRIPTSVIKEGAARHQEFVALSFLEKTPKLGKIHSFLSYLWGKGSKIEVYTLSSGAILARVPSESTRQRIFDVSLWHIDGDAFIAQKWSHQFSFQRPSLEAIPVWVRLNKVPFDLISDAGLNHIAGALGPLKAIKSLNGISSAEVKIEMNLSKPVPNQIELEFDEGRLLLVDVTYLRLPPKCPLCHIIGHRASSCSKNKPPTPSPLVSENVANQTNPPSIVDPLATGSSDSAEETSITPIIFAANVSSNPTESDLTLAPSSVDVSHVASVLVPCSTSEEDVDLLCTGKVPSVKVTTQDAPSPPNSHLEVSKDSNGVEPDTTVDNLIALATITELENMSVSPTLVCINEAIESPTMDSARALSFSHTSIAPPLAVEREVSEIAEAVLGSNKFASLISLEGGEEEEEEGGGEEEEEEEEEEKDSTSSIELSSMDLMSPSGRRFLRERPVKPSAKAKEMHLQYTGRGRGNRGRGNRGRGTRGRGSG